MTNSTSISNPDASKSIAIGESGSDSMQQMKFEKVEGVKGDDGYWRTHSGPKRCIRCRSCD